eukprot:4558770-Karenia_brevis.AAC.1
MEASRPCKRQRTEGPVSSETVTLTGGHSQPDRMITYFCEGRLCDCEIYAEGHVLRAHRSVLVSRSDYFHGRFASAEWADSAGKVELGFSFEAIAAVVDFIYKGFCNVRLGEFSQFIRATHYLQVADLVEKASLGAEMQLSASNVLGMWSVADDLSLTSLRETALLTAASCFETIVTQAGFTHMPLRFVHCLLDEESLVVTSEIIVFQALASWVQHQDSTHCSSDIETLLSLVRYPNIPLESVRREVESHPIVLQHPSRL